MSELSDSDLLISAKKLMQTEANEILNASERLNNDIVKASRLIYECKGRVVVVGLGKSGHVGRKISATLASLGTPSFFLHAAEAAHGDLGMVRPEDVGLFISNSGSSSEIVSLLPHFRRIGAKMIAVTGSFDSPLAKYADIILDAHVETEGDPLQLAPMSSTTLELVMGDSLAALVTILRGLKREDFALYHPGGALGRKLLTRVRDVMNENVPSVRKNVSVKEALFVITGGGYGAACILDDNDSLIGIFTDGDLRRLMERKGSEAFDVKIEDAMTRRPRTISPDSLAAQAVKIMEQHEISVLIAIDNKHSNKPVGIIHIHELLKAGVA